ncbi:MAG: ferrochelatase [Flavobacteriaceae bacterium]|nr:ferrochelatase [Flavobacteriaceae bacterium]
MPKKCLLLVNVGTPDTPQKSDVRRFLTQFLNDKYVINLPFVFRKLLVNGIIVPFRTKTSVKIYNQLWAKHGRILDILMQKLTHKLQQHFEGDFTVKYAMRYGNPSIEKAVKELQAERFEEVVLFPLFPHNAMSTRTTAIQETLKQLQKVKLDVQLKIAPVFFNTPQFINALASQLKGKRCEDYDHIVFSFHGLPDSHIRKAHKEIGYPLEKGQICSGNVPFTEQHTGCYKAECYETARLLAEELGLCTEQYSVAFQSRMSKNWLQPFTDETILNLAEKGAKKILVFTPSFTIDCLETLNEIGEEYAEEFHKAGGQRLDLVECLNDSDEMVELVGSLIE